MSCAPTGAPSTAIRGSDSAGAPSTEDGSLNTALPWSIPTGPGPGEARVTNPSARLASSLWRVLTWARRTSAAR